MENKLPNFEATHENIMSIINLSPSDRLHYHFTNIDSGCIFFLIPVKIASAHLKSERKTKDG